MSNVIEVQSAVHGIAPRSDELLLLGADVDRGRAPRRAYDELIKQETAEWLEVQAEAGIDIQENGKLGWQDNLRAIVKSAQGFADEIDEAPVTRWFEENQFYRRPTITGRLSVDYNAVQHEFSDIGSTISLLAPGSFADLCDNNFTEIPAQRNVLQLYAELLSFLEGLGVTRVVLESYARNSTLFDSHEDSEYNQILASWFEDIQFSVISPDRSFPVGIPLHFPQNYGVEVRNSSLRQFARLPEYARPALAGSEIWQPVVDTSKTALDAPDANDWPLDALALLRPARLVLTHTVDCRALPLPYAKEKIKQLGEVSASLREKVEEKL